MVQLVLHIISLALPQNNKEAASALLEVMALLIAVNSVQV